MKPIKLGSVWTARANCHDENGIFIGTCMDTPNAIAKAMMEVPEIEFVNGIFGFNDRKYYQDRMKDWNVADSHFKFKLSAIH